MLPTDIKSSALRDAYYQVQKIMSDRYEANLRAITDRDARRKLKEQFNKELKATINYYVNMC